MRWCATRAAVVVAALLSCQTSTGAQPRRTAPPTFEPGDVEGLVVSPNPRIRHAWKRKVFWKASVPPPRLASRGVPAHSAAERAAMTATLDALAALLKATPTGGDGEGFWVLDSRTFDYVDPSTLPDRTPPGKAALPFGSGYYPFRHEDIETNGTWKLSVNGETESAYFEFNRLPEDRETTRVVSEPRSGGRPDELFYLRPRVTAMWQGLPVYEQAYLLVTRPGRDPWTPVPLATALKAAMAAMETDRKTAEDRLDGYRKKLAEVMAPEWEAQKREQFEKQNGELRTSRPANYAARQRSLEIEITTARQQAQRDASPQRDPQGLWYWSAIDAQAEATKRLAELVPAEAEAPACYIELSADQRGHGRYALPGTIVAEASAPGCRQIVRTNREYFDLALPRTTPQILYVSDFGRCVRVNGHELTSRPIDRWDSPPQGCVQHARMWREVDWSKIAALVAP